jgi:hypothetical protein
MSKTPEVRMSHRHFKLGLRGEAAAATFLKSDRIDNTGWISEGTIVFFSFLNLDSPRSLEAARCGCPRRAKVISW